MKKNKKDKIYWKLNFPILLESGIVALSIKKFHFFNFNDKTAVVEVENAEKWISENISYTCTFNLFPKIHKWGIFPGI